MNVHDAVTEKIETAIAFARDGAFATAARLLQEAGAIYGDHNDSINRLMFGDDLPPSMAVAKAKEGLQHLRRARAAFVASGNRRTLARVRLAVSSGKGAVRAAGYRASRASRGGARG